MRRSRDACSRRSSIAVHKTEENVVINEAPSLPYGGEYRGLEDALRHGQGFRACWDRFEPWNARGLEPRFIAQSDHVAVLWRHKAENAENGQRIDLPAVSIYRFLEGKIVDSRMCHFDTWLCCSSCRSARRNDGCRG